MRTSGRKTASLSIRWPLRFAQFTFICIALAPCIALPAQARAQEANVASLDMRSLFALGITLGVIAFAIGTALVCLRATKRAQEARDEASLEAEHLRASEHMLQLILAAEPQILLVWMGSDEPRLLAASLSSSLGVPREPTRLLRFEDWLSSPAAAELRLATAHLVERGEAFNLTLRTKRERYVEADGRASGGTITLKIRDLAGQRLKTASSADRQQRLEAEGMLVRNLLDALPSPAWLRDSADRLIWVNRAYAESVGASTDRAVQDQMELLSRRARETILRSIAAGQPFHDRVELDAGPSRSADAMVAVWQGARAGMLLGADGSNRNKAEEAVPLARFRSFDRLATAFAVFDAEQRLAHFNQAYVDLWQLDPEWLAQHPRDGEMLDRLRQARRLPEKADYQDWKRSWLSGYGHNSQREDQWHLPDGRSLHVIADSTAEGGVTYLYENVTEQLALESRYNALAEVQRETLDTLREGVAVFAANGRLRLYNSAFAAVWRLSPRQLDSEPHIDELISWCRVLYDNAEEWERTKAAVTAISTERSAYETEFDRPDGSVIACAALPLPDGGTLLTYVDVSDSKRAERALIERNEALEAADRLKTAFISHVSYELRTPLTNIIGFTELLASPAIGPLNPKQHDYLTDIRSSGHTLLAIIDDILDLATIDAGTFRLKFSIVQIHDIIEAAAAGVRERLRHESVSLVVSIEPDLHTFTADGARVTQILYNLLSNAIGFSAPQGRITLICEREDDMIAFAVEDQGCGIPEDYQPTVFDRFESRRLGSGHRGAGLGLSIVKSLAELHGGTVTLWSTEGKGTRVRVLLPMRPDPAMIAGQSERRSFEDARRAG